MMLLTKFITILSIWVLSMNGIPYHVRSTSFSNDEVIGVWQLVEIKENNISVEDEQYKECGLTVEIEIWAHDSSIYELGGTNKKGYWIGKTDYLACSLDPNTFETGIYQNLCYVSIIQDLKKKETWYRTGEGTFIKYHVSLKEGLIIFEEKENKYDPHPHKRILKFKRKQS